MRTGSREVVPRPCHKLKLEKREYMLYVKPEIVASYYTGDIIGTAVGGGSSCVNNDPNAMCDMG